LYSKSLLIFMLRSLFSGLPALRIAHMICACRFDMAMMQSGLALDVCKFYLQPPAFSRTVACRGNTRLLRHVNRFIQKRRCGSQ